MELEKHIIERIVEKQNSREKDFSEFACKTDQAIRFLDTQEDIRPAFFHDADKIIHSGCYSRYIDKTQVFYLIKNDHISHRVLHVQLVSKIARTIGRFLNLNEDLIEAIALGHDVGHTPFGHNGEKIVSTFCEEKIGEKFEHNIQSFRLFHDLENHGKGLNLTVQVLDGIICHNGEIVDEKYEYNSSKTKEDLLNDYRNSLLGRKSSKEMKPMTLEACVMRISDVIAYLGRDIEDAIILKLIERKDIPLDIVRLIGNNNKDLINNLIIDIVNNSYDKNYISFSKEVFEAMDELKKWNYDHIYNNPKKMIQDTKIKYVFDCVLDKCLNNLQENKENSSIIKFVGNMNQEYLQKSSDTRIVADYVSGMTDDFLLEEFENMFIPQSFGSTF